MNAAYDIFLTTDPGCDVDDQFVIAHLAISPEFKLHGIVTTHAPNLAANGYKTMGEDGSPIPTAEITKKIALETLDLLPIRKPPVFAGSSVLLEDKTSACFNEGVKLLLKTSQFFSSKNRLVVIVIGAATDVASALILEPSLAERIEILALAFQNYKQGTDPFNVRNDVFAWQVLLESTAPLTIADLSVAKKHLVMDRFKAQKIATLGSIGNYLSANVINWIDKSPDLCQRITGNLAWPIWDQAVTAHLLGFTKAVIYPRPQLLLDTSFKHDARAKTVKWVTFIDEVSLWSNFEYKIQHITTYS